MRGSERGSCEEEGGVPEEKRVGKVKVHKTDQLQYAEHVCVVNSQSYVVRCTPRNDWNATGCSARIQFQRRVGNSCTC